MNDRVAILLAAAAIAAAVVTRRPPAARRRLPARADGVSGAKPGQLLSASTLGLGAGTAAALVPLGAPLVLVLAAGLAPAGVEWVRRRRCDARLREGREAAVVEVTFALAGELRAGRTPTEALTAAARVAGPLADAVAAAAASVSVGGSAAAELADASSLPGAARLGSVAAVWAVTESAGGRVALVLERLGEAMDQDQGLRREMQAALAAPRATMVTLGVLPVFGLGLGQSIGAHPLALLLYRPLGWGLLAGAAVLEGLGIAASRYIARWTLRC